MLQQKAKKVADKLGKTDFRACNGWLESFQRRHSIVFNSVCEETKSEWRDKLCARMDRYEPDIANSDETGLFFQALPNKTFCSKGEKCSGVKLSKK
jgi:hypothetical protein